mgnify:CR=1 FL=1
MILKNKYQQAEEYIKLTPDMEQRILEKIRASRTAPVPQIQPQPPFPRRFPIPAALAACFALAVLTLFLYPRLKTGFPPGQSQQPPVQIASPIVEYPDTSSLAEALSLPAQLPEGYTLRSCSILNGEMAQLIYEKNGSQLTYRITEQKNAPGDDISGDYNQYTQSQILERPWGQLTLKGDGTAWSLLLWSRGGYTCSVSTQAPLTESEAAALVDSTTLYEAEAPTQ